MAFERIKKWLTKTVLTADYRAFPRWAFRQPRDLPFFNWMMIDQMLIDPTIRLGLAMRAAPLSQAEFAYKVSDSTKPQGFKWVPGIQADKPEVARFVHKQLNRIWRHELHKILSAQIWGWFAGEVTYKLNKEGQVEVDEILHRYSRDCFAMMENGKVAAVKFTRVLGEPPVIRFPKAIWHAYDPENESPYGNSVLRGALSPWADKWLNGGGLDVRRLFMHKDAYGGMRMGYPAGTTNIDGKGETPNRDIAREIVEQAKAGSVITHPTDLDPTSGKDRWQIEWAHVASNPVHILQYPKDLDREILNGLEIPDDVLTSEGGGAWQGKQVPMQMFFTSADRWLNQVVRTMEPMLESLVLLNWGRAEDFQVTTKPLAEQAMEQMKPDQGGDVGGGAMSGGEVDAGDPFAQAANGSANGSQNGNGNNFPVKLTGPFARQQSGGFKGLGQRFSIDDDIAERLVGSGALTAGRLVEAGRKLMDLTGQGNGSHKGNGNGGKRVRDGRGRFVRKEKPLPEPKPESFSDADVIKMFALSDEDAKTLQERNA